MTDFCPISNCNWLVSMVCFEKKIISDSLLVISKIAGSVPVEAKANNDLI